MDSRTVTDSANCSSGKAACVRAMRTWGKSAPTGAAREQMARRSSASVSAGSWVRSRSQTSRLASPGFRGRWIRGSISRTSSESTVPRARSCSAASATPRWQPPTTTRRRRPKTSGSSSGSRWPSTKRSCRATVNIASNSASGRCAEHAGHRLQARRPSPPHLRHVLTPDPLHGRQDTFPARQPSLQRSFTPLQYGQVMSPAPSHFLHVSRPSPQLHVTEPSLQHGSVRICVSVRIASPTKAASPAISRSGGEGLELIRQPVCSSSSLSLEPPLPMILPTSRPCDGSCTASIERALANSSDPPPGVGCSPARPSAAPSASCAARTLSLGPERRTKPDAASSSLMQAPRLCTASLQGSSAPWPSTRMRTPCSCSRLRERWAAGQ
mmetsp:Transcript_25990/g.77417  ORF Transcript_25990/g.77417 Transcript_25990/m.77417 type:complete len:383 (-) Transcript_25990:100-1248(-)